MLVQAGLPAKERRMPGLYGDGWQHALPLSGSMWATMSIAGRVPDGCVNGWL